MRIILFVIAGILSSLILKGQDLPDLLKKGNEIYFSFQVKTRSEINDLTKLISIDNIEGNHVKAYANMAQYLKFQKLGYEITLLPAPGDSPGVEMTDHIVLSPLTTWNYYPTYPAYETLMAQFQSLYPGICHLDTITTLESGRRLLVLKISDNANTDEPEPEFFYSSSIHGDETTGYILMLHLADYLLSNYGINTEVTDLVNNMEIYICPLANPDGTYFGGNTTVNGARRFNINGVDLNRNYPDPQAGQHPDDNLWQPETVAFMDFATQHHFVSACNLHGGAELVNYPWDTWEALHPDDNWYQYISREYADTVHMHAPSGYMTDEDNGVTNGYAWYTIAGGRQDYMNYYQHCREITIELSATKQLPAASLPDYWNYNWRSFILLLKEARYGIHGIITDQVTGNPVAAKVFISGHDNTGSEVYSSANIGDYHRPLKAGTYNLEITAPCYQAQTISGVVVSDQSTLTLNIQLVPSAMVTTTEISSITFTGATSGGNVTCDIGSPVTARGVCWSTAQNPLVTGSHTTDGFGSGTFTSLITGLSASTTYHVRAYATNGYGTVYGTDMLFTTSCASITTLPWNEDFDISGTMPVCWSQVDNQGNGQIWQFGVISGSTPPPALIGNYAFLNSDAYGSGYTQNCDLVTPTLDLTGYTAVNLAFKHYFWSYPGSSGKVYYSINNGSTWSLLAPYSTMSTSNPASVNLAVNATAGQPLVKFKWNYTGTYGYYWAIDDVTITGTCAIVPVSLSISPSSNPVYAGTSVTFTALPVNGGTNPAYQWMVNGVNAGVNSDTYTFIPANNDLVTCVMTSNAACTSGNPATSNAISMSVIATPSTVELQNFSVADGQCYNASQTITVAGNETEFTVLNGGSATLIAGQNIVYLPGTTVDSGGYMHGYISINGTYCNPTSPAMVSTVTGENGFLAVSGYSFFKTYPNPSPGTFVVEVDESVPSEKILVEIYRMTGDKILSTELTGEHKHQLSISGNAVGIYLLRVITEHKSGTLKIVKQD